MAMKIGFGKGRKEDLQESLVEGEEFREAIDVDDAPVKKAPTSRVLLLLLLLVVVAGAGYFYLIGLPEEEPAPLPPRAAAPVKQPIVQPPPEKAPEGAAPAPAVVPAKTVASAEPAAAPAPAAAVPPPAPAEEVKPAASQPGLTIVAAAPAPAAAGAYFLDAGTYLIAGNRVQVEKAVRRLGFEPKAIPVKRTVEMVRLRVGVFPPEEAKEHLREVSKIAHDAFTLRQGDEVAVYAGSFFDLDKARTFADIIYERGIRTEEETAKVPMTLQRLTFGSFSDQAAAAEAAAKATAAGLAVTVVKR